MAEPGRPFSPARLVAHWAVNRETVRRLILQGRLRAFRVGNQYRIRRLDAEAYERENDTCATASDRSPDAPTSTLSGPKRAAPEPWLQAARTTRKLRRFSPTSED